MGEARIQNSGEAKEANAKEAKAKEANAKEAKEACWQASLKEAASSEAVF